MRYFHLKCIAIYLCLIIVINANGQSVSHSTKEVNSIIITGTSNINTFVFIQNTDSITSYPSPRTGDYLRIAIPVKDFKTGNPIMYLDFIKTLKAKDYPNIYIDIPANEFAHFNNSQTVEQNYTFYVTITNADHFYKIKTQITNVGIQYYKITGNLTLNLLDFNITPPQKMLGMIKVDNDIDINFCLFINLLNLHWFYDHDQIFN